MTYYRKEDLIFIVESVPGNAVCLILHMMNDMEDLANRLTMIDALQSVDRHDDALRHLITVGEIFPNNFCIKLALARSCKELKRYSQAIEYLLQASLLSPGNYDVYHELGEVYLANNDYRLASEALLHALAVKPDSARALALLSAIKYSRQDALGGVDLAKTALEIDPSHAGALRLLALCSNKAGESQQAEFAAYRALEIEPDKPTSHAVLGSVAFDCKKYSVSKSAFAQALSLEPSHQNASIWRCNVLLADGMLLQASRKYHETLALFNQAIEILPQSSYPLWHRGVFFARHRKLRKAFVDFHKAMQCSDAELSMTVAYRKLLLRMGIFLTAYSIMLVTSVVSIGWGGCIANIPENATCALPRLAFFLFVVFFGLFYVRN